MAKEEVRLGDWARLAVRVAGALLPLYSHKFSPHRFTPPQLMACLCLRRYLALTFREPQRLLEEAQALPEALGLGQVPHYSTLAKFFGRLPPPFLELLLREAWRGYNPSSGRVPLG